MAVNSTRLRRKASNHLLLQRARIPLRKGWECVNKILAFGLAAACAALTQEAIPYSLDCQRHILVDENHYFEAIDVFDDYDIDFDVIRIF